MSSFLIIYSESICRIIAIIIVVLLILHIYIYYINYSEPSLQGKNYGIILTVLIGILAIFYGILRYISNKKKLRKIL